MSPDETFDSGTAKLKLLELLYKFIKSAEKAFDELETDMADMFCIDCKNEYFSCSCHGSIQWEWDAIELDDEDEDK